MTHRTSLIFAIVHIILFGTLSQSQEINLRHVMKFNWVV